MARFAFSSRPRPALYGHYFAECKVGLFSVGGGRRECPSLGKDLEESFQDASQEEGRKIALGEQEREGKKWTDSCKMGDKRGVAPSEESHLKQISSGITGFALDGSGIQVGTRLPQGHWLLGD